MQKRWDIFCKVVDNFGDIGICWRLAKQLNDEYGLQIRLWVDDLDSAQKIISSLNTQLNQQYIGDIVICKWHAQADFSQAADVVIEAFACGLPPAYLAAMTLKQSKWINLEYLSAEPWVDDFHAKPSPQANGLTRYFYFPGFTEATGGLIREAHVCRHSDESRNDDGSLKISLFCYLNAPIADLFNALQPQGLSPQNIPTKAAYSCVKPNNHAVSVYVPQSPILPNIADYFGKTNVQVGDKLTQNNLSVEILPFLSQADYDALLASCDLNFVRGEDSWIRAIWAGKPFIWQPYIQDENAHMKKLDAFLNLFYANCDKKQSACEAHRCWSAGQLNKDVITTYLNDLQVIYTHTQQQAAKLASQADLAAKFVIFCNKIQ